jgi:hypothetical protein
MTHKTLRMFLIPLWLSVVQVFPGQRAVVDYSPYDTIIGSLGYEVKQALPGDTVVFAIPQRDTFYRWQPITIDKDMVIVGTNSATGKIMHINANGQVFRIVNGNVSIADLSLRGGEAQSGGGIFISGATTVVSLDNVVVMGGAVDLHGGGIYDSAATVIIKNCFIHNNSYAYQDTKRDYCLGGGIFNWIGKMTIMNSTISDNRATDFGGGIANFYGEMNIENSAISDNFAYSGGGIFNKGALTITRSTINGNRAAYDMACGGGIYNENGIVTISNCTICYNTCFGSTGSGYERAYSKGGAIYTSSHSLCTIINSTIFGDTVTGKNVECHSGGVYFENNLPSIMNTIIAANVDADNAMSDFNNSIYQLRGVGNIVGDRLYNFNDSVDMYHITPNQIFGIDTIQLSYNGGSTRTFRLDTDAVALGRGYPAGTYIKDTIQDTMYYKKPVTVSKAAYFDGSLWRDLQSASPIQENTQITELVKDQRGAARNNPPSIGSCEIGLSPTGVINNKIVFQKNSLKLLGLKEHLLTAMAPVAGVYTIKIFNIKGQIIEKRPMVMRAGFQQIRLSQMPGRSLYIIEITGCSLKSSLKVLVW